MDVIVKLTQKLHIWLAQALYFEEGTRRKEQKQLRTWFGPRLAAMWDALHIKYETIVCCDVVVLTRVAFAGDQLSLSQHL